MAEQTPRPRPCTGSHSLSDQNRYECRVGERPRTYLASDVDRPGTYHAMNLSRAPLTLRVDCERRPPQRMDHQTCACAASHLPSLHAVSPACKSCGARWVWMFWVSLADGRSLPLSHRERGLFGKVDPSVWQPTRPHQASFPVPGRQCQVAGLDWTGRYEVELRLDNSLQLFLYSSVLTDRRQFPSGTFGIPGGSIWWISFPLVYLISSSLGTKSVPQSHFSHQSSPLHIGRRCTGSSQQAAVFGVRDASFGQSVRCRRRVRWRIV